MNEEDRLALIQTIIHLENNMVQPGINIKKEK